MGGKKQEQEEKVATSPELRNETTEQLGAAEGIAPPEHPRDEHEPVGEDVPEQATNDAQMAGLSKWGLDTLDWLDRNTTPESGHVSAESCARWLHNRDAYHFVGEPTVSAVRPLEELIEKGYAEQGKPTSEGGPGQNTVRITQEGVNVLNEVLPFRRDGGVL